MLSFGPRHLECLGRVIEGRDGVRAVFAVEALFPFGEPEQLRPASERRARIAAELGAGIAAVDKCSPKPQSEVVVSGMCFAPGGVHRTEGTARLSVGSMDKRLTVVGDRFERDGQTTAPQPFRVMPLDARHAFGGAGYDPNPEGKGAAVLDVDGVQIRPIENVRAASGATGGPPAGFGPLPGAVEGNVAPTDQRFDGPLEAGQKLVLENMHPEKELIELTLPRVVCRCFALLSKGGQVILSEVPLTLDTAWLFPHAEEGICVYRGSLPVSDVKAAELSGLMVAWEDASAPRPLGHYAAAIKSRIQTQGAPQSDADLVPDWVEKGVSPEPPPPPTQAEQMEAEARAKIQAAVDEHLARARGALAKTGKDPDEFLPPISIDDVASLPPMEMDPATVEQVVAARRAEAEADIRKRLAEHPDIDADEVLRDEPVKPPRFTARAQLAAARELATEQLAKSAKPQAPPAELTDPAIDAQLDQAEAIFTANHLWTAHFHAKYTPEADEAAALRASATEALGAGESLAGRDLAGADLSEMSFEGADLRGALLEGANLSGANLAGADLSRAVLPYADLSGANLRGARLTEANLGHATLTGASLAGADLTGVVAVDVDFSAAEVGGATLPDDPTGEIAMRTDLARFVPEEEPATSP